MRTSRFTNSPIGTPSSRRALRTDNPLKARWMGFFDGQGIHGTDQISSLGESASHGCIRTSIKDVKQLYDEVKEGTAVFVQ